MKQVVVKKNVSKLSKKTRVNHSSGVTPWLIRTAPVSDLLYQCTDAGSDASINYSSALISVLLLLRNPDNGT